MTFSFLQLLAQHQCQNPPRAPGVPVPQFAEGDPLFAVYRLERLIP